jgi:outer membrane protein assembly factor BamB
VPAFEEVWRRTIESPGAPRLAATSAYVVLAQSEGGISCHAAEDGHEVWHATLPTKIAPVIGGTLVFVVSNGQLHALDLATGASRWVQKDVGEPEGLSWHENRLVVVTGQEIRAWLPDGRSAWRQDLGASIVSPTAIDGDTIFVALSDQKIVALDANSGTPRWTLPLETAPHALIAAGGRLFFAGADDAIYSYRERPEPEPIWRFPMAPLVGLPVADNRCVYVVLLDNTIWALKLNIGNPCWRGNLPGRAGASPSPSLDRVVVALTTGELVALKQPAPGNTPATPIRPAAPAAPAPAAAAPGTPAAKTAAPRQKLQDFAVTADGARFYTVTLGDDGSRLLMAFRRGQPKAPEPPKK